MKQSLKVIMHFGSGLDLEGLNYLKKRRLLQNQTMFGLSVLAPESSALLTLCDGICTVVRKPSTLFRGGHQSLEFKTSILVDTMNIFLYCQSHIFFQTT